MKHYLTCSPKTWAEKMEKENKNFMGRACLNPLKGARPNPSRFHAPFLILLLLTHPVKSFPSPDYQLLADKIKIIEGLNSRFPYGIKSVYCAGELECRQVCINTLRNNYHRWLKTSRRKSYLEFLADRYCPISADPAGHKNWLLNIRRLYAS